MPRSASSTQSMTSGGSRRDVGFETAPPTHRDPPGRGPGSALSGESLQALLRRLDPDETRAGHEYEALRQRLIVFFLGRRCRHAEESADETLDRLSRRIGQGLWVDDPARFAHGIARRVHSEALRQERGRRRAFERMAAPVGGSWPVEEEAGLECIRRCLGGLDVFDRELIVAYYDGAGAELQSQRRDLADRLGLTATALRLRAYRIRRCVEQCTRRCLQGQTLPADTSGDRP
jgi:DNA-directed RNA polymerase specialized sigma24 family protein